MLKVHHGPFHPNLEDAFLKRLSQPRPAAARVAVVTPSRRLADRLQRLAAVEGGLSLLGVHFHSFHSLALAVVEEDFPDRVLVADPVFHDRLVDSLLESDPGLGALFGGEARPKALAGALRASLRDLIDAGVSGEAIEEFFGPELLRDERQRAHLAALLKLSTAYEARLEALKVLSPSGLIKLAAGRADASALLAGYTEILYYGFYDLTGLQLAFFEAVVARHPARVFFPFRRKHPAFRFAEPFFEQKLMGYELEEIACLKPPAALAPALDALFDPGRAAPVGLPLHVISASGAADEAWAAAKEVLRLVEKEGFAYEEIGVVARTLEPYRRALADAFRENAIPFDMVCGEPLLRHPVAKCVWNLLSLRQRDFPAVTVEDLFASPYYNRLERGPNPVFHWRRVIKTLGIRAGWLQWKGKLERRCASDLQLLPRQAREGEPGYVIPKEDLASLWRLVSGLASELGGEPTTWAQRAAQARRIVEAHLALPAEPSEAERAAWDAALAAIDSLAVFDRLGAPCPWSVFLEALDAKLRASALDAGSGCRGVRLLSAMDARGESFKVLFLIGLKEKFFPRQVAEDPLLRDGARAALRHPAGYWIGQKAAGHEEERLLFYLAAGSAKERLICIFPRSDEAGKAEVPSLYLRELCRAAGTSLAGAISRHIPRQPAAKLEQLEPELGSPKELSLRLALEGGAPGLYLREVGESGELLDASLRQSETLNAWGAAGGFDGLVGPPEDYLAQVRRGGLSPSALDSFERCPFQFFAERVLGLSEDEQASAQGDFASWMRGQLYHSVLERLYSKLDDDFWADPSSDAGPPLEAAVESVFRENDWQTLGLYPLLWQAAKEAMTAHLRSFVAWDLAEIRRTGLRPSLLEKRLEGAFPGTAPAGLQGLKLKGIVDRVDRDQEGKRFRIVDYKTRWGKSAKLSDLVLKGQLHQLPVYAELAGLALGPSWTLEGAALLLVEEPEAGASRALVYEAGQWAKDRPAFLQRVSTAVEQIAAGRYPIRPQDGDFGYCGFCSFSTACRKSHGPSRQRAETAASST